MKPIFLLIFLSLNILPYTLAFQDFIFKNLLFQPKRNPDDLNLREWLNKLIIDLPNDLIKNEAKGYIENLTIYNITLEALYTERRDPIDNKIGVEITFRNVGLNIKGKYIFLSSEPKNFLAKISTVTVKLPFFLVKNESGLITEVDTTGFTIDLDNAQIDLDLDTSDVIRNIVVGILKLVLKLIKTNVIEKNLIKTMNEKLAEAFEIVNHIILNGMQPDKLNITINEKDLADIRNSSIIGSVAYLLSNLTGADGPLSLNNIINIFTNDTGIIHLKKIYKEDIHFEFNITDKDNNSLGTFELSLDDLNVSGLNTWRDFNALEPYDPLQLLTYTNLDNLTINITFSLRVKLENTSKLVQNKTILYEKALLRTNLKNNKLIAYLQFPFNNRKSLEYTNEECLNMSCIIDLADSNGTGINALSLNETFTYITLEVKEGGDLEEGLDDTISKLTELFIKGFNNEIGLLINALLNTTLINLANKKANEYLSSETCPGIKDPDHTEIDIAQSSIALGACIGIFFMFIFSPYILCKACKKKKEERIIEENDINREGTISSEYKEEKVTEARYCINNISIKWMKELGRIDPEGASLFLNPRIPILYRILFPLVILLTIGFFVGVNSSIGISVFMIFHVGRRIQVPPLFDFRLLNSVEDMWKAGSWLLAILVFLFTGFWPYMKLIFLLFSFCLPTSIISHKNREKILMILDAIGKFCFLDTYVMLEMLIVFHLHIQIPVVTQSFANDGAIMDIFFYAAYGFITLIIGTSISSILSHIMIHLHRSLDSHPDENKGEKAESNKSIMSFAKNKCIGDKPFRIIISSMLFLTLGFAIAGSLTRCVSSKFLGLAGYTLELLKNPSRREFSVIDLGLSVTKDYENSTSPAIIFTQVIYFLTVLALPLAFLIFAGILWFVPMSRKAQTILYKIVEILNAWSCIEVFVLAIISSSVQVDQFTKFIVGDKCNTVNPLLKKYFSKILDGHDTCLEIKTELHEGCWLFVGAAVSFVFTSFVILKVSRNALKERLPDHVKEYLKIKTEKGISRISNINDLNSRTTLVNESLNNNINKNFLAKE